jgi:hypothetical protein
MTTPAAPRRHFHAMGLFRTESKEKKLLKTNVYVSDTEPESQGSASDTDPKQPASFSSENEGKSSSGSRLSRRRKKGGHSRTGSRKKSSSHKRVSSNADPLSIKGTEQLGPDMMILATAFHLDKNTQVLLAYYDARTLEDFCCMTQVDFDELKVSAERLNRALPPLQLRKVQVLREWVQRLAKKVDNTTPLWALDMPERVDKANLIPKDWKRKFKDDLPDLKHALKERGEKQVISMSLLTNSYHSLVGLFCGQELP